MPAPWTKVSTRKQNRKQRRQGRQDMTKLSRDGEGQEDESRHPASRPASKRGKVMHETTANRLINQLHGLIAKVISPPNTRAGASNETAICKEQLLTFCEDNCSPEKVFGCPRGVLPAVPKAVLEGDVAPEDEAFGGIWAKLKELAKGSTCEAYLDGYLFRHRKYWARCYHPTAMTLDMTASSRVEGVFGAMKTGRIINRKSTLNWVKEELAKRIRAWDVESTFRANKIPTVNTKSLDEVVLDSFEHFLGELGRVKVSHYAHKRMMVELHRSSLYDTTLLANGDHANDFLKTLAEHSSDHDVCREVPEDGFDDGYDPLGAKFGATSLPSFSELVEGVRLTSVVKVVMRYSKNSKGVSGHIVVVGPDGFQLCTCLQMLRCGLPCRHILVVLFTKLERGHEFDGDCIHPRWRSTTNEWSISKAPLSVFNGHERGVYEGGFTDDFGGVDIEDNTHMQRKALASGIKGKLCANMMESCTKTVRGMVDHFDVASPNYYDRGMEVVARFMRDAQDFMRDAPLSDDPHNISRILNPPDSSVRSKKESRHRDCTELGPSRKKLKAVPVAI